MRALTIRDIDSGVYERLKEESKKQKTSLNKLVKQFICKSLGLQKSTIHHDLDEFFGSWTKDQAKLVNQASKNQRKIDRELW